MKSLPFVVALFFVLVLSACKNSGSGADTSSETGVLVPLAPYNVWLFDHTDYDLSGNIKKETTDSVQIYADTRLNPSNNITAYDINGTYVANLAAGYYIINPSLIYPELWFKYPANVGDRFRDGPETKQLAFPTAQKPDSVVNLTAQYTVAAKNFAVTVPASSAAFLCYKYESDYQDPVYHVTYYQIVEYYAPHIGQIMREEYQRDQSNTLKLVLRDKLVKYKIQP